MEFDLLKYKGLDFPAIKPQITHKLGSPVRIYEPNYDCGFLSSYEQSMEYYSLDFGSIIFTGNDTVGYLLKDVDFDKDSSVVLNYGEYNLTANTNIATLVEIFGLSNKM